MQNSAICIICLLSVYALMPLWMLSVPDDGYSRNEACALNLISTFLSDKEIADTYVTIKKAEMKYSQITCFITILNNNLLLSSSLARKCQLCVVLLHIRHGMLLLYAKSDINFGV